MNILNLAPFQIDVVKRSLHSRVFLEGQAGNGKTTVGIESLLHLLRQGVSASSILVLAPQRTLIIPYQNAVQMAQDYSGGQVSFLTVGGLARRMVDLFWPLVAERTGVSHPERAPSFLTLETGLYYMAHLVRPLLDQGFFDSVAVDRNRLYSQILDNLNKAAIVGFPHTQIGARLQSAWLGETAQTHVVEDAQHCATLFRNFCLENSMLDFSLQIEIFNQLIWPDPICREYLQKSYSHLIYENVEEDTPVAHDILREWLPQFNSALLIYDQNAGYRKFLGADPESGHSLVDTCNEYHVFTDSFVSNPALASFTSQLGQALERTDLIPAPTLRSDDLSQVLCFPDQTLRFYPQMLDWIVESVQQLIDTGTAPGQIVLIAPFLPDSLRYALANRLEARGILHRSHRPSRSLRDEPAAQALITLAALAHPDWQIHPSHFEVAYALMQIIDGLDLVRSQVLVETAYRTISGKPTLVAFENLKSEMRERITYTLGNRYETLRLWLESHHTDQVDELDFFFSRLFGEVLSQPGFAFHTNYDAGTICQNLIESAQKFRWAVSDQVDNSSGSEPNPPGKEYLNMIQEGVLAAQYIQSWQIPSEDAVLIAPAYTYLLTNQPVDYQFWIDIGSPSWAERLSQPLTHPIILSRGWPTDRVWTDIDEFEYNRETLYKLTLGLTRRCRKQIFLAFSEISESGYEGRGMLLRAIYRVLQQSRGYNQ